MSDFTDDNEEVYEVEKIVDHRKQRAKHAIEYLIKWKDYDDDENTWERESNVNAPELVEAYWQRNGGQEGYEEAKTYGKKKQAKQRPSSTKLSAPVRKRSTTPSQQRTMVEIFTSSSSSSRSSSNNVTPEIPASKRSLSPLSTKDEHNKRIRHDEDEDDNQSSSPVKEIRAAEKESTQPTMEAAENEPQQPADLTDEEPQQSTVEAIPEEDPEPSNDEVIQEEEPQRSPVKEIPEESQQTIVEDISKEPDEDMTMDVEEDESMEEAPARERSASRALTPDQHMTTSDTDMVDELLMTDEEFDKPTTTSMATKPIEEASSTPSPSKLSQSDIRTFVNRESRPTSRATEDFASQLDKLTGNKENIAVVSDMTTHDDEEHLLPGTPKDKQLKEINVNDIIWDPEYPPEPCNWSEEAECVETVVADPNDRNTFHAIVRWKNGKLSMHQSSVLREKCPHLLIDFYETRLKFTKRNEAGIPSSVHISSKHA